ncbi:ATP phosphoribosyltransferase regulatory subunit [Dasania marina]|uniref:ATP phosphoribosyltransferase regulatory subunit n=1 Tax=Dasania marina TaxID=471499 RepID=UPI0030DB3B89|tara:strand:- start:76615 stop:77790 length:1176 start_codon:yes stop_codon:yes gene_type:complete
MTIADRWLLPDGVEELLPEQAEQVEALRRKLLDLYHAWGYELVMPPLLEFTDSLLVGLGTDVDLQTFKVVDQLSGRTMGIRPDMTIQIARIDAHCLKRDDAVRLCYAGSVLHTRPKTLMASRSPIQLGAELYGDSSINSDIEIICLMLETLRASGIQNITLDLGHVSIYRALLAEAGLEEEAKQTLFDALQRKSGSEINALITEHVAQPQLAAMMQALTQLNGGREVLAEAAELLAHAGETVQQALAELAKVADSIAARMPDVNIYFDLSELRGYHYHTGLVFAALAPGMGQAVANGGRYDDVGKVFGRARPATGFSTDLKALLQLLPAQEPSDIAAIAAPNSDDVALWQAIQQLRAQGERVLQALSKQAAVTGCDRQLVLEQGAWVVKPL